MKNIYTKILHIPLTFLGRFPYCHASCTRDSLRLAMLVHACHMLHVPVDFFHTVVVFHAHVTFQDLFRTQEPPGDEGRGRDGRAERRPGAQLCPRGQDGRTGRSRAGRR